MSELHRDSADSQISTKLKSVAEAMATPPSWYADWAKLTPESTDEERLRIYQAIRRSAALPDAASFFLVSHLIDNIATENADEALRGCEQHLKSIEKQYRLSEGGVWPAGMAPAGYEELRRRYYRDWGEWFAQTLEHFGEPSMARLFREDQQRFDQLSDAGREYFFGPRCDGNDVPEVWLHRLLHAVAECMVALSPVGPLGYRYGGDEGVWEIDIYPTPVELIGGARDGEVLDAGFSIDIEQLRGSFERIDAVMWESMGHPGGAGPNVTIEGRYEGHEVFIQVLAYAPVDEEPGMKIDTTDGEA